MLGYKFLATLQFNGIALDCPRGYLAFRNFGSDECLDGRDLDLAIFGPFALLHPRKPFASLIRASSDAAAKTTGTSRRRIRKLESADESVNPGIRLLHHVAAALELSVATLVAPGRVLETRDR